jgi:outer membrane protein OmpA-like peptidoglycan-associated protein
MRKYIFLLAIIATLVWTGAQAQSDDQDANEAQGHPYVGFGINSIGLDNDRVPGVPTSSPGHASKTGNLILGYQFDDLWAADVSLGTDFSGEVDTDVFAINGYRFFGSSAWRPYVSAGLSHLSIDDAVDDDTQQVQAGFGISGNLNRNLELRVGYQRLYSFSDDSYHDNAYGASLAWHFRKPETVAQVEPQPESVPVEREVVETVELLVQFDFDKAVIKSAFEPQFRELAEALEENPDKTITIEGHTCWIGTDEYNQGLSERRAGAVKQKLVDDYGVDPERLEAVGYGESRPVADNNTLEGRQQNRRAIAVIMQTRTVTE